MTRLTVTIALALLTGFWALLAVGLSDGGVAVTPRHMRRRPVVRLAAVGTAMAGLFAALMFAACSMAPRQSPPDTVPNRCGETGVCEGS